MTGVHPRLGHALLTVAVVAVLAGCQSKPTVPPLPVLPIGGDFQLTDDDGQPFTLASQRGRVILIFFGYSSCPDACPTTLSKLSTVARRLGDEASRVRTLYVSVDPERDTPPVLKADLASFSLDAVGLTGTKAEIDRVVEQYGAAYEVVPTPGSAAPYTISHTTAVYALDTQGRVRTTFAYEASVDEIVTGIRTILADQS
ncbi:MAG: SCO family protein [Vicinamibacterales bacterium]